MWRNGKVKIQAFSLVEIMISMAIFSFIFSIVTGIALILVRAQVKVQAQVFLTQTAQTTLENLSRNLRYGYAYLGGERTSYLSNYTMYIPNETVIPIEYNDCPVTINQYGLEVKDCNLTYSDTTVFTQKDISANIANSPYIVYESQSGNPYSFEDQNAYCIGPRGSEGLTIYKLERFRSISSNSSYFDDRCDSTNENALDMLPKGVNLEEAGFDVYGESAEKPTNPMVRIRIKLSSEDGGTIYLQTTITQRLIQIL